MLNGWGVGVSLDLQEFNDAELLKVSLPVEQGVDPNSLEILRIDELGEFLRLQTEFKSGRLEAWSPGFRAERDTISKREGPATVSFVPTLKPSNVILDAEIYGPDFLPLGAGASYIEPVSLINESRVYSFDWVAIGESENNRGVVARSKSFGLQFAPSKEGRYLIGLTVTDSATGLSRFFSKAVTVLANDSVAPVAEPQLFLSVEGEIKTREPLVYRAILLGVEAPSVDFVFETPDGNSQLVTDSSGLGLAEASFSALNSGDFTVTVTAELPDGTVRVAQRTVDIPTDGLEFEIARLDTLSNLAEIRDATSINDIFSKLAADIILDIQEAAPNLTYQLYNSGEFFGEGGISLPSVPSTTRIETAVFPGVNRYRVELDDGEKSKVRFVQKTLFFNPLSLQSSINAELVDVGQVVDVQGLLSGGVFKVRPEDSATQSRYRIRVQWGDGSSSDDYLPVSFSQGFNLAINEAVPLAQHVYQEAGDYTIEVTLQDFSGKTVTDQLSIEVRDESAEPTPEPTPAPTETPQTGSTDELELRFIFERIAYRDLDGVAREYDRRVFFPGGGCGVTAGNKTTVDAVAGPSDDFPAGARQSFEVNYTNDGMSIGRYEYNDTSGANVFFLRGDQEGDYFRLILSGDLQADLALTETDEVDGRVEEKKFFDSRPGATCKSIVSEMRLIVEERELEILDWECGQLSRQGVDTGLGGAIVTFNAACSLE